jgi:saccharopine dehydrogenase-like NADP-dependent oxidoreductase
MYAEVTGNRGGESVTIRMDVLSHEGLPRMDAATGLSAAVGILMMGRGQIAEKGVYAPEGCVDSALFLEQLDGLGLYIKESQVS